MNKAQFATGGVVTSQLAHKKPPAVDDKAPKEEVRVIKVIKGMTVVDSKL
jgi:hypothetical protein